jgi:signal transduction histidine kinase
MNERNNGDIINGLIMGSLLLVMLALIIVCLILIFKKRQHESRRSIDELQSQFRQELLRSQLEIQEQTLKNISQEIHDNIGQMLSLAKLNLALADCPPDGSTRQKIQDSRQLVSKAIQDLRDLSRSMNTDYVSEMGLHRSIEYELEMINKTGAMQAELNTEGIITRLENQKELILFRIVQESLNNIIKHADARNIIVTINYLTSELFLSIRDNGQGVDLRPLENGENTGFGLGIRNMHNRAVLIGAQFNVHSTLGKGTEVTIRLPQA